MKNRYNVLGREFIFEIHDDDELTSNLIRSNRANIDLETVYAYEYILNPGDIMIDIGSNIGWNSLFASFRVGDAGKVIAIEPDTKNFNLLKNNISYNNINNIHAYKFALNDENIISKLYKSNTNFGNHILNPNFINFKDHTSYDEVESKTFDFFLEQTQITKEKIKLIKIDAEGSEAKILQGAKQFFSNFRPNIVLEFNPFAIKQCGSSVFEIMSFIEKYNYIPYLLDPIDRINPHFNKTQLSIFDMLNLSKDLFEKHAYKDLLLINYEQETE